MVGFESGERMLNSCVMHRQTGPAPGIMGMATAIFQQDDARPHLARIVQRFFVNHHIELLPWPARSPDLSTIENMWSMIAQGLTQITTPYLCHTRSTLATCGSCLVCCTPKNTSKVSLNQFRGVWQR
ncbi:uncharacterized protein TNCV_684821 [Trichonephila clavipes]|nr:uncharacterized protein TNCV_684821 [Trichonephila clavipes]